MGVIYDITVGQESMKRQGTDVEYKDRMYSN